MKNVRLISLMSLALMIMLAACAPASTPTITAPTSAPAPTSTESAVPASTSTTAPLDLAGPPMKVGSTYLYFDGATLVAVPGGSFLMGHGGSDNPEHTVTLSDFWIYATKITNSQFQQCVAVGKCTPPAPQGDKGYNNPDLKDNPVTGVTWAQSEAYCEYANGQLPTEAQWEKTARGPDGNLYPWGDNGPTADLLNYNNIIGTTTSVIQYPQGKSFYDALDMEGNAYEWVFDWYDPLYYSSSPNQDPQGPDKSAGGQRSVRSASYKSNNDQVVSAVRSFFLATDIRTDLGFRCVVKDPTFFAPACTLTTFVGQNLGGNPGQVPPAACDPPNVQVKNPSCPPGQTSGTVDITWGNGDTGTSTSPSGGCQGSGQHYTCPSAGSVTISYTCGSAPVSPSCPQHYNPQGGVCVWDGSGTGAQACPAGQQLQGNCCASINGTGTNFSACPIGFQYNKQSNACEQNGAPGSQQTIIVSVGDPPPKTQCTQACTPPVNGCGYKQSWCKASCSCQFVGKSCP